MTRPVYLGASGLVCARGASPTAVAAALAAGESGSDWRQHGNRRFPWFALPLAEQDWLTRAEKAICLVAESLGPLPPTTPLFVASSSFQIGLCETRPPPYELPIANASFSRQLASWMQLDGPRYSFSNACISGFSAIDAARSLIAAGQIDGAVVLGCELANASTLAGFAALELLSPTACRPFDRDREGLVLGEAVAAIHLTAKSTPWRLAALRTGIDAWSITGPDPEGGPIAELLGECLQEAGLAADDIDLVKLQAAGSPGTDLAEANALRQVFATSPPPLLSFKSAFGHTLGASGVAELTALLACLDSNCIPATAGFATADPQLGLQPTTRNSSQPVRHALLNLIGFGGGLASMIVTRER
ncbi:MAG: beta-ketoacyl synthase [Betaproteobacteria bacterium HGW-Betaproteobacteria-7]|jgi:3-oxoacyl-[acyl-carrier-protein] synthase-1|nr:MAG: beta-ketoacyl synthase [Betaproteobacteria bacterium HGW-Betaproteobacteria-7]